MDSLKFKRVKEYLNAIYLDLSNWYQSIFVKHDTWDIHYLDSSLLSSFIQLELLLFSDDIQNIESELELF